MAGGKSKKRAKKNVVENTTFKSGIEDGFSLAKSKAHVYKLRRPHRSFRRTRRRDYTRSFKMPGYFAFTNQVWGHLLKYKKTFLLLTLFTIVAFAVLVGAMSQDTYESFGDALNQTSENVVNGQLNEIGKAGMLLLATAVTGGLNQAPSEIQQVFSVIVFLVLWLTTVWLIRYQLSGKKVKLRDGLYNACSPIISTFLVALVIILQALPVIIAVVILGAAMSTDFFTTPLYAVVTSAAIIALGIFSLYLFMGSIFAMVIITIQGMYPLKAIKISGDLVVSRRLRLLKRLIWMALNICALWIIFMIPIIILDGWLKSFIDWLTGWPVVPIALLVVTSVSVIYAASYIYLLYRRLIVDDADPA
ncbi:MAG: hypothetical protein LBH36_00925 [Candidatus Nomurabacteria bacterium]|jgi:hypothetical protein|nr:hypothetical protein [Candidatus Nomurabacteria bacterium]